LIRCIIFFICLYSACLNSQVKGKIFDETNQPVPFVNVLLKAYNSEIIISYTVTTEQGEYQIEMNKIGKYRLFVSGMTYQTKTIPIEVISLDSPLIQNINLTSKIEALDEVIIQSERPITVKKDTIVFDAKAFTKGNEVVVEDLLKKIPGLDVDSEGTIRVGNKEVEKVMVEGDDFFEKGYKVLTKSMPSSTIDNVEVLERYANNKHLKGIEYSDKVALNLTLNENAKRQWFGNFSLGHRVYSESDNRYEAVVNLMNFGKKNKYYALTNLNNTGSDATGSIYNLIRPTDIDETANIGYNETSYQFINVSDFFPANFKKQRSNFNNAELASLNAIFNPNKKLKIKTLAFFNWDETNFFRNYTETFTANQTDFINTEKYQNRTKSKTGFGKLDVSYNISKTRTIISITKYSNIDADQTGNLIFNALPTIERLSNKQTFFDQKLNYTNKFNNQNVVLITGHFIKDKRPQNYRINQYFFEDLFAYNMANNIAQVSENALTYFGTEAHFLNRKKNKDLLEIKLGFTSRGDKLTSHLDLKQDGDIVEQPSEYQNTITYTTNNLYLNSKYLLKLNTVSLIGELNIHQLFNKSGNQITVEKENPFFINPSFGFKWKINKKNKLSANYAFNRTNASILDIYPNYILTGYRSLSRGTGTFNQLDASTLIFNYQLGNWSDKFFVNTFIIYNENHDFFSTDATVAQNYSQSDKIKIENREFLNISTNIDRYFKFIKSNLKLKLGVSQSNYKNRINGSDLREITSTRYNYGFETRSAFKGIFNYHLGSKWLTNKIRSTIENSYTENTQFLDMIFDFSDKLNLEIQTERYYFGNLSFEDNTYYFMDFKLKYIAKKNKLSFSLNGKNIFNTEVYRNFQISDISTTTTEFQLLPAYLLLKMDYRF